MHRTVRKIYTEKYMWYVHDSANDIFRYAQSRLNDICIHNSTNDSYRTDQMICTQQCKWHLQKHTEQIKWYIHYAEKDMYRTLQMIHTSVNIESKALPAATGGGLVLEGITTTQRHAETAATVLHSVNDKFFF